MNKQDSKLALSVVATLISGIALIYTMIMFPQFIFAVAGISLVFIISAFILTQNILSYASSREKYLNTQIKECVNDLSHQIETMGNSQAQIEKATFLYTKQTAQVLSTLENNYTESQEALYKNLTALSSAQNKSTKLMIKYDQSNTTKVISTLKDLRNQLSDTMIQGFDQIQPNNDEVVKTLEEIVNYLKSQPIGIDQSMGVQLNNVAHELQNISNSIQRVQVNMNNPAISPAPQTAAANTPVETTPVAEVPAMETLATETPVMETSITETPVTETPVSETLISETTIEEAPATETPVSETSIEEPITSTVIEETAEDTKPATNDPNKLLSADEIATLFEASEPSPKKEPVQTEEVPEEISEEEPFTPTFTVVGKEEPVADTDPNKQLSPDEIAALFAAADPAPKKAEKPSEPEPVKAEPLSDDPNKQLSPDEIAALFAAAEPTPKKEPEPVKVEPISDDPNKQLSPDEIAALFASLG